MRKIIAILVLVFLAMAFYYYIDHVRETSAESSGNKDVFSEDVVLKKITDDYDDFLIEAKKLQANPDQIAELNCMITRLLYSGKLEENQVEKVFSFQREFYCEEMLEKNPKDINLLKLTQEIARFKDSEVNMIGYKLVGPQYVDSDLSKSPMLIFSVIYYLNIASEEGEVYKGYVYRQNKEKLWELYGFGDITEFPTINK